MESFPGGIIVFYKDLSCCKCFRYIERNRLPGKAADHQELLLSQGSGVYPEVFILRQEQIIIPVNDDIHLLPEGDELLIGVEDGILSRQGILRIDCRIIRIYRHPGSEKPAFFPASHCMGVRALSLLFARSAAKASSGVMMPFFTISL